MPRDIGMGVLIVSTSGPLPRVTMAMDADADG